MNKLQSNIDKIGYLWLLSGILLLVGIGELYVSKYQQWSQAVTQSYQKSISGMGSGDPMLGLIINLPFIMISIFLVIFAIVSFVLGYGFLTEKIRNWKITFLGIFSPLRHRAIALMTIIYVLLFDLTLIFFIFSPITQEENNVVTQVGGGSIVDIAFITILIITHFVIVYYLTRTDVRDYFKNLK
jgi:hypothetical protein